MSPDVLQIIANVPQKQLLLHVDTRVMDTVYKTVSTYFLFMEIFYDLFNVGITSSISTESTATSPVKK
jgi:hypothetical protein